MLYKDIGYFKGLNALRFIAASLVVLHHGEALRIKLNTVNYKNLALFNLGGVAVEFFFVLSGFLITYLMLKEIKVSNTIAVRKFYFRRIVRIWPLYFLLVFLGTLLIPFLVQQFNVDYEVPYTFKDTWMYFVFFMPSLVTYYWGHHLLEPLWSIGVEEWFYLMWAPLIKLFKQHIFKLLAGVLVLKYILNALANYVFEDMGLFREIVNTFAVESMAVGGLGALFLYKAARPVKEMPLFGPVGRVIVLALLGSFMFFENEYWSVFHPHFFSRPVLDLTFIYVIILVSIGYKESKFSNSKLLNWLGELSYGIYMYHMLVIGVVLVVVKKMPFLNSLPLLGSIVFYILVFLLTITVAALSKKYFENRFMPKKKTAEIKTVQPQSAAVKEVE
ncbi:MAG: hypothetical protein BGO31_18895 [Bacteroidetes bacterium 43-16]|nr:MAG: hypothetical protein BGO31_18895 [Bacteroidetes bacterium 43-16]